MSKNFTISGFSDEIDSDIVNQFEHLKKLGICYFEPRGINDKNIADLKIEEAKKLKKLMDEYGIKASSIGSPIGKIMITDSFDEHLDKLRHVIKIAKILGTKYIRIFSFYIPDGDTPQMWEDEVFKRMRIMAEVAQEEGVILLHENEHKIYGETAESCLRLFENVNFPSLKCVFDAGNFSFCGYEAYPEAFNLLKDKIEYLHIKDAKIGGNIVPPGDGDSSILQILTELSYTNKHYFVSLEPHLGYFKGLESLANDARLQNNESSGSKTFTYAFDCLNEILSNIK